MTRREALARGVRALTGLAASACRRDPGTPSPGARDALTFSISLAEDEQPAVRALLDRFARETGERVRVVSLPSEMLPEKLKVDARAGRPTIDLFAQDNLTLRPLVDGGLVEDLTGVALPDGILSGMVPPLFAGRQYFLPFRPNVQVTYANRERLRRAGVEPPATADGLLDAARRLKAAARGQGKVVLSLAEGAPAAITVSEWIVAFGGDPLVLSDDGSIAAFTHLQAMWREGLLARESLVAKYDTQVDHLQGETAWIAPNWPFTSTVFAEQDILDRFTVYAGWRGPVRAAHVVGGDVLGIPRGVAGSRRETALALARYLVSRDAQRTLAGRNGWPSVRADAYAAAPPALRETFAAVVTALADGWYRPAAPHWPAVSEAMNEGVRRILERGEAVRPVLDRLHARVAAAARAAEGRAPASGRAIPTAP